MANSFDPKRILHTALTTKRWWVPLFVIVVVAINVMVLFMPKKFRSEATVVIHEPQMSTMTGAAGAALDIRDRLDTIREEITSFRFLDEIARRLNLTAGMNPSGPEYDSYVRSMANNIELRVKNQDLFSIYYTASNAKDAHDVTDAIVKQYIRNSSGYYEDKTEAQKEFIRAELAQAEQELQSAQDAVTEYKNNNLKELPETQGTNISALSRLAEEQRAALNNLAGLRNGLALQKRKLAEMKTEVVTERTVQQSPEMQALKRRRVEMDNQLQLALADFTEEHWSVKELRKQIEQLDKQIASEQDNQITQETKAPNAAYSVLQDQITQTEFQISQLETNTSKNAVEIEKYEKWLALVPTRQLELERFESRLRAARQRVEDFRKALNQATTTAALEAKGQGPSFELADPPRVPLAPVSPNKQKFAVLSLGAGGAMAGALIYLLSLLDAAVRTVDEARRMLQMPVLGVVQRIVTSGEEQKRRRQKMRRALGVGATATMLIVLVAVGFAFYRGPLQSGIESLRSLIAQR